MNFKKVVPTKNYWQIITFHAHHICSRGMSGCLIPLLQDGHFSYVNGKKDDVTNGVRFGQQLLLGVASLLFPMRSFEQLLINPT